MSAYTNISIDSVVRMKAEKILDYHNDKKTQRELEIIKEEKEGALRQSRRGTWSISK